MTLRARLVAVAAIAVVIAVLGAAAASYVAARSSLLRSVDDTLRASATATLARGGPVHESNVPGLDFEYVTPEGHLLSGGGIPVTELMRAAAMGTDVHYFATITLHGQSFREYVLSAGTVRVVTGRGLFITLTPAALTIALPLSGVDHQLSWLVGVLVLVVLGGVILALVLAWLVGRTALVPVNELIEAIEDVATTSDVTRRLEVDRDDELGRLRASFNNLLAALDRSLASQRQLVLDAGHELRTPLTSLRTNIEVIRRLDELSPADRSVLIDDLLTQMNELTSLVGDLSELARGDQSNTAWESFRLDQLVEEVVALARTHARDQEISFYVDSSPCTVFGPRDRIERAIGNLVDNARKWSATGGSVEVSCRDGIIFVRDHGPGINPEDIEHIFDRFYRAPSARGLPGSGLGLAIVAQAVKTAGGTVAVTNAPDGGAVFRLAIPLDQGAGFSDEE